MVSSCINVSRKAGAALWLGYGVLLSALVLPAWADNLLYNTSGQLQTVVAGGTSTGAPVIISPPASSVLEAGLPLALAVNATGTGLSYQWKKDNGVIPGATGSTLVFPSLAVTDAGSYTVVVSNSGGSVTSNPAVLSLPTSPLLPFTSVSGGANWTRSGNTIWHMYTDADHTHGGVPAIGSGTAFDDDSYVEATYTVSQPITLAYWMRIPGADDPGYYLNNNHPVTVNVTVNGLPRQIMRDGDLVTQWVRRQIHLPTAGVYVIRWQHLQNGYVLLGDFSLTPAPDTDHDGLSDDWEMEFFQTLDKGPTDDTDYDSNNNLIEYVDGTNPTGRYNGMYDLIVHANVVLQGHGQVQASPPQPPRGYPFGTKVTLTAVPDPGYVFVGWDENYANSNLNPVSFTLYGQSLNIKAIFEPEAPLAAGLDTTDLTWTTGGDAPWVTQTRDSSDGVDAVMSGSLPEGDASYSSWLQTTVTGPAQLSYDMYRSGYGGGSLQVSVDGLNVTTPLTYSSNWTTYSIFLPPGSHVVRWTHRQDHTSANAWAASFLDKVVVTPTTDSDHDGLADEWEMKYFQSLDKGPDDDPDFDGVKNLQEYQEYTRPSDFFSRRVRIQVTKVGNGSFTATPAESSYIAGEMVTFTAVPDPGWVLQSWRREGYGEVSDPLQFTVAQADIPVTLHFEPVTGVNEALDNNALVFINSSPGWCKTSTVTHDGVDALRPPATLQNTESPLTTTVTGPKVLSFWWKFEPPYGGTLSFQDNALPKVINDGSNKNWQRVFVKIGPGQHTLTWAATNPYYSNDTTNIAWIDQVLVGDDSDQDGLPDDWEMANFGNLNQAAADDADGDHVSNQNEWADATDPNSVSSALYHLDVTDAGPGTVVFNPARDLYAAGTQVTLTADPAFTSWSGDATGTSNPLVVTMNNNKNITANFESVARGVDNTKLVFHNDPVHPWYLETMYGGQDNDAASSAADLVPGQESWVETTFTTAGRLSFNVMPYYDTSLTGGGLRWSMDGVEVGHYLNTTQISFVIPPGTHTVRWTYKQATAVDQYYHQALLDTMVWTPITNAIPLDVALDTPDLTWTSDTPAADWLGRSTVTHDGVDAAETLPVAGGGQATLQTTLNPATPVVVSFWWKVSSEQYYDMLHFYKDGVETSAISAISGEVEWTKISFPLPAGPHTLRWVYKKDYSGEHGQDKAWVDELTITPVTTSTLVDALDSPGLGWTTSSGLAWTGSSAVTHDGNGAAASPPITDGQTTWIQTQVTGPGTLTFWWKISSVEFWNPMTLFIDGYNTGREIDGEVDWTQVTVPLVAGTHTVRWSYSKSPQINTTGEVDGAWVDQVVFSPSGGGTPDISLEQPVGNLLADGATSAYGSVAMGGHGYKSFTIRNVGNGSLTGVGVTLDGTNAGDFTPLSLPASTIAPGGSTTFVVDFAPGATTARTALLHIASNDPDENPYDVTLTGSGVPPPDIVVEQPVGTGLTDGVSSIDFGSLNTGAAATLTFTVKNKGTGALSALAYSVDGTHPLDFTVTHPATTSLAVNGSLTFTVKFSPVGAGSRQATLHILSNDPDEGSFDIGLTGVGVLSKPAISQPPASLLLGTGESATFTVGAVGSGSLTYKWLKNAKPIVNATGSSYTIPAVALTDSGSFTATATSTLGSATSPAAVLGVVSGAASMVTVNEGTTLTLRAVTSIPAGTTVIYQWTKDGLPVTNGTIGTQVISGAATGLLSITKADHTTAGSYVCVVAMANRVRTTGTFSVDVRLKPYVYGPSAIAWAVSGNVTTTFYALNNPTAYTFIGLPAGVTGTSVTSGGQVYGVLSGKPNLPVTTAKTFTVTARNAAGAGTPMTVSYTVAALPAAAVGTFNGLVARDTTLSAPIATPLGQKLQGHGGSLTLAVTTTGSLTGKLNVEDKSYTLPATARLDATVGGNPSAMIVIPRGTGIASFTLSFSIDRTTGHLTGTLTDGLAATPVVVEGWKQSAPVAAMVGSYTAALILDPALTGTGTTAANVLYPQGGGYLTMTLSTVGAATWGGKLADGTVITGSSSIGSALDLPFHQLLYTPTVAATAGAAHGWLKLSTDNVASPVNEGRALLDGTIDWNKKPQTAVTRVYKAGFNLHNLTVSGGKYAAPTINKIVLNLPDMADNAKFTFSEGGLSGPAPIIGSVATSGLNKSFRITKTNTLVLPAAAQNPAALTLKLITTSGAFSGGFSLKNDPDPTKPGTFLTRPVTFDGILVPRLGQGVGWFLLAELPATGTPNTTLITSPQLSGKVIIDGTP